ncbi:RNA polymerase sigma factor [Chryseosolibacter indicus]|uniref:RNA polymerase sigma-70 factor n=1 Tax=Chryseosolibacter indicus TaxID=2782351 RepID=A0ABS5VU76_9BACT|nr:RNA polymerase sigma-70 factor [Chryseosolibacter indicus]MBT1704618.1 RNA polymerase sigma-70 factor [Chryseosolibacter indicus]
MTTQHQYASYSDEELIRIVRNDSKDAFAELFNRHWENVYNMIYSRIKDVAVTEEMTQEIFMKLWDKRSDLSIDNFSAYLYSCVKYKCINYIESKITQKKHWEHYKTFLPRHDESTSKAIAFNELNEALEKGLATIPKQSKLIFKLNKLEGWSVKEIAEKMNLSEKAIQYHLTKSAKELRLYLKDFVSILILLFWL